MPHELIVVLAVAGTAGFFFVVTQLERHKLLALAAAFPDGAQVEGWLPPRLVARQSGYRVEYLVRKHHHRHRHGHRHHTRTHGHSVLTLRSAGGPTWTAAPEGLGSSLLKGLGVMSDIELGVEDLDRSLRFTAKAPRRLPDMLTRDQAEGALRELSSHPRFAGLRCTDAVVEARYTVDVDADYDERELLRRLIPLVELAKATGARPAM